MALRAKMLVPGTRQPVVPPGESAGGLGSSQPEGGCKGVAETRATCFSQVEGENQLPELSSGFHGKRLSCYVRE